MQALLSPFLALLVVICSREVTGLCVLCPAAAPSIAHVTAPAAAAHLSHASCALCLCVSHVKYPPLSDSIKARPTQRCSCRVLLPLLLLLLLLPLTNPTLLPLPTLLLLLQQQQPPPLLLLLLLLLLPKPLLRKKEKKLEKARSSTAAAAAAVLTSPMRPARSVCVLATSSVRLCRLSMWLNALATCT